MSQEMHFYLVRYSSVNSASTGTRSFRQFSHSSCFFNLGVILAGYKVLQKRNETNMRIIYSWCRGEGQIGLVDEKAPLEDRRETHSICMAHRIAVQARWRDTLRVSEGIGRQLASVSAVSEMSSSDGGRHLAPSATHFWVGLKNLTRKARA
ncbi:MAG: hypothetical protein EWM72_03105 [Nitrospira sp.]|nr:MAG: hypothetical protein EWM72_03105 [Nitrospira sp.]